MQQRVACLAARGCMYSAVLLFRRSRLNFHLWSHCWGGVTCSYLGCWVAAASISVTNEREGFRVCYSECGVVGCAAVIWCERAWAALDAAVHSDVVQPTVVLQRSFVYLDGISSSGRHGGYRLEPMG